MSFSAETQLVARTYRRVSPRAIPGLETAERYLREHWRERPTLDELAAVAGLSPCHFHHLFSRHFGFGPKWLATELQMREARRLLLAGVSPRDVTTACGFANPSHFTARFKRWTGLTPVQWLRQERAVTEESPADVVHVHPIEQAAAFQ
jgi:AraC-like DNA-binding protein